MQQRAANLATKRARPAAHTGVTLTEPMTLAGLRRAARAAGIRENAYKLQGARDETYCLAHEDTGWVVFFQERGKRVAERVHPDKVSACEDLLARLMRDPTTRETAMKRRPVAVYGGSGVGAKRPKATDRP